MSAPPPAPLGHHAGAAGGGADIEKMIAKHQGPCAALYYAFEECLGEHDREFRACQPQVAALRECTMRQGRAGAGAGAEDGKKK
jgi:hypothetical protein